MSATKITLVLAMICNTCAFWANGQSTDTTTALSWSTGLRIHLLGGISLSEGRYISYKTATPSYNSALNELAGFRTMPITPIVSSQFDYNVLRNSKKLSLYTGIHWNYTIKNYHGIRDSLAVYQRDTTVLSKRIQYSSFSTSVALNGEKILGFHTEIGVVFTLFEIYRFGENRDGKWNMIRSQITTNISASRIYTSLGYSFKMKGFGLTPIARLDYYPFYRTQFAVSVGIILTIQKRV